MALLQEEYRAASRDLEAAEDEIPALEKAKEREEALDSARRDAWNEKYPPAPTPPPTTTPTPATTASSSSSLGEENSASDDISWMKEDPNLVVALGIDLLSKDELRRALLAVVKGSLYKGLKHHLASGKLEAFPPLSLYSLSLSLSLSLSVCVCI